MRISPNQHHLIIIKIIIGDAKTRTSQLGKTVVHSWKRGGNIAAKQNWRKKIQHDYSMHSADQMASASVKRQGNLHSTTLTNIGINFFNLSDHNEIDNEFIIYRWIVCLCKVYSCPSFSFFVLLDVRAWFVCCRFCKFANKNVREKDSKQFFFLWYRRLFVFEWINHNIEIQTFPQLPK